MLELWKLFSDGKIHKAGTLAAMLSVSEKTVYRDVELLRDMGLDFMTSRDTPGINKGMKLAKIVCPCCGKDRCE